MLMSLLLENIVPMSDFSHGKADAVFGKVAPGAPVVVVESDRPCAVIITPKEYAYLAELEEDLVLRDLGADRLQRMESDPHARWYTMEEVLADAGITKEEIEEMDEVEFE